MKNFVYKLAFAFCAIIITNATIAQTCSDGIQNGDETGIDCGGSFCAPCNVPCNVDLSYSVAYQAGGCCTYVLDMDDSFGDGWNGASMNVVVNGVTYGPYSATGSGTNVNIPVCHGESIVVNYLTAGSYPSEVSYSLIDPQGNVVFQAGPSPTVGNGVFNGSGSCLSPIPLNCNGGEVVLVADGQGASFPAINNDFDPGNPGPGWNSSITAQFNNPCDPSIDGGTYLWMGNTAPHPRILETVDLDLSCGGTICFYLDFATQGQASPCEGIDLANEGVFLDFSTNGGASWTNIEYFGPAGVGNNTNSGGTNPQMTSWNQYCYDLPPGAFSANTRIRWAQTGSSGIGNDHWGIDNVTILTPLNCSVPYYYDYVEIPGSPNNDTENVVLTSDSTFNVIYTNGTDSCQTSINIVLPPCVCPEASISGGGQYCTGDSIPAVIFTVVDGLYPIVLEYAIDGVTQPPLTFSNSGDTLLLPAEGDYTLVSVSDGNSCSGVISSNTVSVIENTIPVYTDMTGGGTYCAGDQVDPILVSATNATPLTVSYTYNGVAQTNVTGTSPVSLGSIAGTYIVTSVSNGVCSVPVADTQVIVVNPMPVSVAGVLQTPICQGQTLSLNGSPSSGTVQWVGPNGFTSSVEDPTIANAQPAATGSYYYIVNENNCIDTSNVNVVVIPNPVLNAGPDFTVCEDSVVTITATGATTYSWNNGISNGVPFAATGTTTYVVTGTSNGCSSTDTIVVTVLPTVYADGYSSINSGYEPLPVQFQNTSANGTSYIWNYGDGYTFPTSSTSSVEHLYTEPGTYYVTLTATNGYCQDTWMDSIIVIPYPAIVINVPNVFTPSSDGVNDIYFLDIQNAISFEATIVNRWGNVVATLTQPNEGWNGYINGKLAEDGVYFITYRAVGMDQEIVEGQTFFHLVAPH